MFWIISYKLRLFTCTQIYIPCSVKLTITSISQGVCSTWLSSLDSRSEVIQVPVWVVPGTIRFPRQPDDHVIMVGPGTGCAPFRTYIEERVHSQHSSKGT